MRIKKFTLMTLTFVMMSVVAFAQKPVSASKKALTPYQQILQAKRQGLVNEQNAKDFKFAKPALPQSLQKTNALQKSVKHVDLQGPKQSKAKAALLNLPGKVKVSRRAGAESYVYHFISSANGWTNIDADGDGYTWDMNTNPGYGGESGCMTSASYVNQAGALTPDNYLVSPKMKLDGKITFWACGQDASWAAEHFGVAVSTASATNPADFTTVQEWTMTAAPSLAPSANFGAEAGMFKSSRRVQGTWYEYTIDLSSYAGAEGYVAIRHFDCTDMFQLNVDEVTLETSELLDPYDPTVEVLPEKVVLPDGATVTPYYTIDGTLAVYANGDWANYTKKVKSVNVAFVGTDVYIQGLAYWQAEGWVKGTLADNVITVPSGQYVGEGEYLNGMDDSGAWLENYTFAVNTEAGTIACDGLIAESASPTANSLYAYWIAPVFSLTEPVLPYSIVTPPAGLETEDWTFAGFWYDNNGGSSEEQTIQVGFDGNDVYVQGFDPYLPDAWIKGELTADGKIKFAAPQYFGPYDNDGEELDMFFVVYDFGTETCPETIEVNYDAEKGVIEWSEDYAILTNSEFELSPSIYGYYVLSVLRRGAMVYPDPQVPADAIAATAEEYQFKGVRELQDEETGEYYEEEYKIPVFVAIDGNDVWVQGVAQDIPDKWIKGTLDGNKVTFPTGQHIGTYPFWLWEFEYFLAGYGNNGMEDIVMNYDAEAGKLTMESPEYWMINAAWLVPDPNLYFSDVSITKVLDVAATPAQPEITNASLNSFYPYISFAIPTEDVDGNPILTGKLYYRFFSETEHEVSPIVLSPNEYTMLSEEMTEIPYNFTDDYDIYNYELYLNMDFSEWNKIGIQSIYRGGGEEKTSEISWFKIKKYNPAVYDFAAAAEAGENPDNLNGGAANGAVFYGWESVSKADSKRQDYKGYTNYTGTNLPKDCHVWRRSDRINGNVKDGGLFCPSNKEMAINGLEPGYKIVIDFDATNAASDKLLWVPGKGEEPQAIAVVGNADRSAVSGITEIASGDTIYFVNGAKDYFVFRVLKNMVIKKITIIDADPKVDFLPAYGVYADPETQHGTVTADIPAAVEGETVTLSNTAESGYCMANYVVKDAAGNIVQMKSRNQFVMPAGDVYVSAEYNVVKDMAIELTEPCNISDAVAAAVEPGTEVGNLTIKLTFNTAYTITNPIEVRGAIKLIGENSTIDASGLTQPLIQMSKEPAMAPVESGQYIIEEPILIEGVLIEGLTKALFYDNGKSYTYKNFTINNSVFQYDTQDNVVLNLAASMAINLNITKSTFWSKKASSTNFIAMSGKRPWQTTGFENETGKFICANNTFYNIAKNKQFFNTNTLKGQKYLYEFNSNIFANTSNKKIYGNMTNNTKQLTTDGKNTYLWGELDYSDPEYVYVYFNEPNYNGDEGLKTNPKFADADKGDFTLGIGAKQQKLETGDPRWLTYYDPAFAEAENIDLALTDGAEISSALAKYIDEKEIDKVGAIYIHLEAGDYTIEKSIEAPNTFTMVGPINLSLADRAKINASKLDGPFVLMSKEPTLETNEKGAYVGGSVSFTGVNIDSLKQQLVYANKTQYLMEYVGVFDCVIGIDGTAKKTIFDFNGGGNTRSLSVLSSTIWANPTNGQNGGFFSSQSSKDVRELDETATQTFEIYATTLYNITNGKTVNSLRKNSQEYQKFMVNKNIIVNCGKSNQFLKGLNAGQAGKDVNWEVNSNVFNFDGAISEEQQIGSSADNIKNTIDVLVRFKDAENGDFTQCYVLPEDAGDPRWYDENAPTAIDTVKGDVERADDGAWYTIQGVRVDKPSKGVFIHNGKKVVVK